MTYIEQLQKKHITVLGLGVTGQGIVRFLLSHGINPKVVDSRPVPPCADWLNHNAPDCEAVFGNLADAALAQTDLIIISPGIPLFEQSVAQAIAKGVEVIGDIELFARLNTRPVIAVTGSNGKSTVVSLATEVLKAAGLKVGLGGNIGTSVLSILDDERDVYVLELSSFQLETTHSLACLSAMILNITEDHMDRYPDFQAYIKAKQRIYQHVEHIVFNAEDQHTFAEHGQGSSVSLTEGDYHLMKVAHEPYFAYKQTPLLPVSSLAMVGKHNQFNALAVLALLAPMQLPTSAFVTAFGAFRGLPHRCQLVADVAGVRYFNDSKATNVGSTVAAIESLASTKRNIILIAGGDAKGADLTPLKAPLNAHCKALFCFGQDGEQFMPLLRNSHRVNNLKEAVIAAKSIATIGDIVLLAPACASIDMYPNYMARGDEFVQLVEEHTLV
ncbi:UDP-N-acetylmuramoyl-L-alanine--D-glutamate ligase [Pseudoalteromonas sp. McH1-7]|uniref:UDP-N-acetylmuramoylalanine--D-glutamate ligase n=1 Tax=Pseudoalteromonas peptidolytica F12-50-A1 TaxID=1315280 RepID=A0A8I0T4R1_9GAMM|nr:MULTISPECIES: UDP-N-acetylmuramoyl-L-alanine--D-glutamate ligase [Pseudoalteromonas]MBE0347250.1 UDP-N-acetylmuramoylalanine--D-glutamate ligase [Pseudoalteromonas peptidolytica F12-50-A1]MDW7549380.1 UDP-N-acetylmuramoyl-L-alanine--D-glutamate ligase [Pseudoalteromonas peptidolytica]NLR13889.1 UDP-N-acetylmuramoyl-L-alanine--D-glutamate ligase [Pseudoalteromonas peptidolytica]NUZ13217.1 UDP-N-acetylmuramoyl-L-alanine--D-glutamate ligase [Pseudoalteromonas sp. McH1-7]USD29035.1 UDP-N-acetyl